jgi:biopolymer transport protein ExbD
VDGVQRELKLVDNRAGTLYSPLVETLTAMRQANEQFKVIIRGEKEMPYQYLEPVLSACSQANVTNVNFNTKVVSIEQ